MNYYQFNIGDYRRDTMHLSRLEHSIYRDLIDLYYLDEEPIPLETQWVSRRLRLVSDDEAKALENVLSDFFVRLDDGFHHRRIDADITKYHKDCDKNRENGKKGGRPKAAPDKAENPVGYDSVPTGTPLVTLTNNQEPITNNQYISADSSNATDIEPPIKSPVNGHAIEFKTFIDRCKSSGEKPISEYKSVWDYAEKAGIPEDFVILAWDEFKRRYGEGGSEEAKRYKDWRKTFRNCVESNWYKLWFMNDAGQITLTSAGRIAKGVTQ
jgi:uncharacterized protein YdaU (DUF1376 family)